MEAAVRRLSSLSACLVSDALDKLGLRGATVGLHSVTIPAQVAGRVLTMRLGPRDESMPHRQLGGRAITSANSGDIIVVEHRGRDDVSGWGGLLSRAAKLKGVAGVIIDGACRDVDEVSALGLPLFSRAAVPVSARGRISELAYDEPIVICGVTVRPKDFVIADGSGVVFICAEKIDAVLDCAEDIAEKEALIADAIDRGEPLDKAMASKYAALTER